MRVLTTVQVSTVIISVLSLAASLSISRSSLHSFSYFSGIGRIISSVQTRCFCWQKVPGLVSLIRRNAMCTCRARFLGSHTVNCSGICRDTEYGSDTSELTLHLSRCGQDQTHGLDHLHEDDDETRRDHSRLCQRFLLSTQPQDCHTALRKVQL